jgi:hypothetical protein
MILQDQSVDRIKRRQQNRRTLASLHEPQQLSGSYVDASANRVPTTGAHAGFRGQPGFVTYRQSRPTTAPQKNLFGNSFAYGGGIQKD